METRPFMVFLCPFQLFHNSHIYIHENVMVLQEENLNGNTLRYSSMVFISCDGDNGGYHILHMLESMVENILTEM